ncbi:MAG: pyridoxal-dependent decarboxylase, exosortase A system-associated [Rhodospirillales bacterium]|nr:MAG: pyridoxal-dependent decarboxylase, exosortase A system-associated [Rhodospirillales bacterium]
MSPASARFAIADSDLLVGGIPLGRLAERVGSTPFFAYDRQLLTERIRWLRQCLPEGVALSYAVKANPMPAVVQHLATLVDGFDVASAREMQIALDTPVTPAHVSFAGPGKTDAELRQAIAAGIIIHVESEGELTRLDGLARRSGHRPEVALRVNPDFDLKASGMRMGGGAQQFGIDAERVPEVLGRMHGLDVDFVGFHIYAGSQNLNADSLMEVQEKTLELAVRLSCHAPSPVRHLNIGGGFGIPYFPKDHPLDVALVGGRLGALMPELQRTLPEARVVVELGRYIVGECGIYVSRIVDRKVSRGQVFLITDGGLNHHLAASGNFGQVIRRNYPVAIGNRMAAPAEETASVVGCLCTPLDLLADKVRLPRAEVGDLVVIFQSGAYGPTASPTRFLGHPPPMEILV